MKVLFLKNVAHPLVTAAAGTVREVVDDFANVLIKGGDAKAHVDVKTIAADAGATASVLSEVLDRLQKAEATIAVLAKVLTDLGVHEPSHAETFVEPKPAGAAGQAEPKAGPFADA